MHENNNDSAEREQRLRLLISKGAELAGGAAGPAVGTVIGSLLAGPVGAAVGGTVGAAATMAVKAIGHDLSSRLLSPREQVRVGGVFTLAAAEIVERCRHGESIRDDGFFDTGDGGRSDAEEVWESTLLKSQREPEEKETALHGTFAGKLGFQCGDRCCHGTSNDKGGRIHDV